MTGRTLSCIACLMACVPLLQVAAYPRPVSAQSVPLAMPQDTRLVVFRYDPNDSYLLLTRPGAVTHIALEPDESVVALALGDTVQWIVQDKGPNVFVKPVRPDLYTSGTLVTNRRTYQLGLRSSPEGGAWYQRVSWTFPGLIALAREADGGEPRGTTPSAQPGLERSAGEGVRIERLNFEYRISGRAPFRPVQVLDDGRFTHIQMPVSLQEMPAVFVVGESGEGERVNYLVRGRFLVVQRLADRFLLRLGRAQVSVERLQPPGGPDEIGSMPKRPFPDEASQ